MNGITELTYGQFEIVHNVLNLTIAIFGGSTLLFILLQNMVSANYRFAVILMAAVVGMAAYHYVRIYDGWNAAFNYVDGVYRVSGLPFNYAYRYADWLSTVPFIVAATILVLDVGRAKSTNLIVRLVIASMLMLLAGYFGEIQRTDMVLRSLYLALSMLPFGYIVYVLWAEMSSLLEFETARVRQYFSLMRWMLVGCWSFYPIVYCFPMLSLGGPTVELGIQVGNSLADILAKAIFGLVIYSIAREKTVEDSMARGASSDAKPKATAR